MSNKDTVINLASYDQYLKLYKNTLVYIDLLTELRNINSIWDISPVERADLVSKLVMDRSIVISSANEAELKLELSLFLGSSNNLCAKIYRERLIHKIIRDYESVIEELIKMSRINIIKTKNNRFKKNLRWG